MKSYTLYTLLPKPVIAIITGGMLGCFGGIFWLPDGLTMVQCCIWVALWGGLGYYLIKKLAVGTTHVTLAADALTIQPATGAGRQVPLAQIVSYAHNEYNGNESLVLRLAEGKPVTLGYNDTFCDKGDFHALVADFEAQIANQPPALADGNPVAVQREKTFFEKPAGNIIGWLIVVLLVGFTGYLAVYGLKSGKTGSLFLIYGNGLVYLAAWRNARRKQAADH